MSDYGDDYAREMGDRDRFQDGDRCTCFGPTAFDFQECAVHLLPDSCPRCGGDHPWCQWVQPGEFGEES